MTQVAVGSDQRGFALVLTMLMLVVFGAIVAGSFFAGWLEQQSAERVLFAAQAGEGAEAGVADALITTAPETLSGLVVGGLPVPLAPMSLGEVTVEREVRRLTESVFFVVARAARRDAAGGGLATRSIGLLTKLVADSVNGGDSLKILSHRAWVQLY